MKRCPFCSQLLQEKAHHCHHCNSMVLDMDGNPLGNSPVQEKQLKRRFEWVEIMMKVFITIFFTVQFFIDGILILKKIFGISILEMNSFSTILANLVLLLISVAASLLISPYIIRWLKQNFVRITK